jgi:hypothetical protein
MNTLRNQFTEAQQATIPSHDYVVWLLRMHSSWNGSEACIPKASPVGGSTAHVPNPWLTATIKELVFYLLYN